MSLVTGALEAAALELCRLRGLDPDEVVPYNDANGYAVARRRKRLESAKQEIREFKQLRDALKVGEKW